MPAGATGRALKAKLLSLDGRLAADRQRLILAGRPIGDDEVLAMEAGATVNMVMGPVGAAGGGGGGAPAPPKGTLLEVVPIPEPNAPPGRTLKVLVQPGDTIESVKAKLKAQLGRDVVQLSYAGKVLDDAQTISTYNLEGGGTLQETARLPGGA
jgi:hypothetical protein